MRWYKVMLLANINHATLAIFHGAIHRSFVTVDMNHAVSARRTRSTGLWRGGMHLPYEAKLLGLLLDRADWHPKVQACGKACCCREHWESCDECIDEPAHYGGDQNPQHEAASGRTVHSRLRRHETAHDTARTKRLLLRHT